MSIRPRRHVHTRLFEPFTESRVEPRDLPGYLRNSTVGAREGWVKGGELRGGGKMFLSGRRGVRGDGTFFIPLRSSLLVPPLVL